LFYVLSSHCCEGLHALHTFLIALLHFTFERCPFFFSAFMADLTSYFSLIKGLHQRVTVKTVQQQKITSSPLMCACLLLADSSQNKFRSTGEFKGFSDCLSFLLHTCVTFFFCMGLACVRAHVKLQSRAICPMS